MIEENKNNNDTNNDNLDYSFDFANQVNKPEETNAPVQETPAINIEEPAPVSSPAPETMPEVDTPLESSTETPVENMTASAETPEEPKIVDVSVPVMDNAQSEETTNADSLEGTPVDNQQAPTTNVENNQTSKEEPSSLKKTFTFVIVLAIIIIAFIVALPIIKNYLG